MNCVLHLSGRRLASSVLKVLLMRASLLASFSFAQNRVPRIVGPAQTQAVAFGNGLFVLTVCRFNFVPGAVRNWNYKPLCTKFISERELQPD